MYKNIHHIRSLLCSKFSKGSPFLSKEEPPSPEQPTRSCSARSVLSGPCLLLLPSPFPSLSLYSMPSWSTPVQTPLKVCLRLVSSPGNVLAPDSLVTGLPPPYSLCSNFTFLIELLLTTPFNMRSQILSALPSL